jgi:large subunit ribosomal protein L28
VARCEICGKAKSVGYRVSHSNIKTKRTFSPNIQRVRATLDGHAKRVYACTSCLRSGKVKRAVRARPVSEA